MMPNIVINNHAGAPSNSTATDPPKPPKKEEDLLEEPEEPKKKKHKKHAVNLVFNMGNGEPPLVIDATDPD